MSIFEGLGKKLTQTGQEAAQKAKNAAESVRLSGMISDEEKRINNVFLQMGKMYFDTYGENPEPAFAQFITDINDARARIVTHSEQIKVLKGIADCTNCGAQVAHGSPFCSSCGSAMKTPAPAGSSNCTNCGAVIAPGMAFCTGCGNKIEAEAAVEEVAVVVAVTCQNCSQELAEGAAFCLNCGTKVEAEA